MASEYLSAGIWPSAVAAAISIALAVWLVKVDWRRPVHRRFGLYLVLASGASVLFSLVHVSQDVTVAGSLLPLWLYWTTASLVALLWFVVAHVRPRRVVAFSVQAASLVYAVLFLLVFILDRARIWTLGTYGEDVGIRAGPVVFADGPLLGAAYGLQAGAYLALWMLARHYASTHAARARRSAFIVTLGFMVGWVFATARFWGLVAFRFQATIVDQGVNPWTFWSQFAVQGVLGVAAIGASSWLLLRGGDVRTRHSRNWAVVSALFVGVVAAGFSVFGYRGPVAGLMEGIVALALPVLATYGILRRQLFDIDVKARFTIKATTLAGIFLAVGFAATEASAQLLGDTTGSTYLGIGVTALLVLALAPLQRLAERVAHAAVPNAKPVVAMDPGEKAMAYAEVVRMAWLDGTVTPAERRALESARARLGITIEQAHHVEQATLAELE